MEYVILIIWPDGGRFRGTVPRVQTNRCPLVSGIPPTSIQSRPRWSGCWSNSITRRAATSISIEARVTRLRELLATVDKRIGLYQREWRGERRRNRCILLYARPKALRPPQPVEQTEIRNRLTISLRDKVLNLYHAGFTTAMIANQLQSTVGEVELIISLLKTNKLIFDLG